MNNLAIINIAPSWSNLLEKLSDLDYKTNVVMTTQSFYSKIESNLFFEFIDIQKLSDGNIPNYPKQEDDFYLAEHDYFMKHLNMLIQLTNRNMYLRDKKFSEIRLFIHQLVNYLNFKFLDIDKYLFLTTPHQISTYITYLIARLKKKNLVIITPTNINYLYTLSKDIYSAYTEKNIGHQSGIIKKTLIDYAKIFNGEGKLVDSNPLSSQKKISKFPGSFFYELKRIYYSLKIPRRHRNKINPMKSIRLRLYRYYKTKNLKKIYQRLAIKPNYKIKYIYFPLHYQPERTTLPEGGIYSDLILAIIKIREYFDEKTHLYVKEHPSTFYRRQGFYFRSECFYKYINSLNNVSLIKYDEDSSKLIQNSDYTISVNGTAVLEAFLMGKRSFFMGFPWYRSLSNLNFDNITKKMEPSNNKLKLQSDFLSLSDHLIYAFDSNNAFVYSKKNTNSNEVSLDEIIKNIIYYLEN